MPDTNGPGTAIALVPTPAFPRQRVRKLRITAETVVDSVLRRLEQILNDRDRGKWMEDRLQRYAKYRGWLPTKTWPWPNAANTHPPVLPIAELRMNAGLHNAIMTLRPLLTAKATQRANMAKEERITQLIDAQLFLDPGPEMAERRFSDLVSAFLQDGNWVGFTPWVRDERTVTHVHHRPPVPEGLAPHDYLRVILLGARPGKGLFPPDSRIEQDEAIDHRFFVTYRTPAGQPTEAEVTVFTDDDDALEIVVKQEETIYDGPVLLNLSAAQVFVPTRVANLQCPSEFNPEGSPYVFVSVHYRLDEVRAMQGQASGFNWLDAEGLAKIEAAARASAGIVAMPKDDEKLEEQKDAIEGRQHAEPAARYDEDLGHLSVAFLMCFDRWDVDGDGESEDVYWVIARDAKVLCEARLLTEKWPASRPYRPLAEAVAIPVPGRWYGISLLELGEHLYDLIKGTLDVTYDHAKVSNLPFFFYAASSAFRAETVQLAPGEGYPVPGNPKDTVWFPNMPTADQNWGFKIIGLTMGFFDRLMSIGGLQAGQVPPGKASALRTTGTTMALLQQGDVRADQLLLRLFGGLRQVARNFHRMNRTLLPPGKELRILGWEGPQDQGYAVIGSMDEIDAEMDFDFRPDFLIANPQVLHQALMDMMSVVATPLAFQLGITDPKLFFNGARDFLRSLRLDPKKYIKAPQDAEGLPPLLWEEAIGRIMQDEMPQGTPMEGAAVHLKKAFAFIQSDEFGFLQPHQVNLVRAWLADVGRRQQLEQQVAASRQFQARRQQQGPGAEASVGQEPGMAPEPSGRITEGSPE